MSRPLTAKRSGRVSQHLQRSGVLILCLALLGQALAGCAEMTQEQKGGATGAGIGAAVGALTGGLVDKKSPARGALLGAGVGGMVGGAVGWAVGAYQVKQVKSRQEVAAVTGYTPQQGVVAKVDRVAATPHQLKPGDQLVFQSQYTVLGPVQNEQVRVKETRTILYNDQPITDLPERELLLTQGTNEVQSSLTLPKDAAEGTYRVRTVVEPLAANAHKGQAVTAFVVAAPVVATPAVAPAAAAPTPAPIAPPPGRHPESMYVKVAQANLREGPGVGFKIMTTVPQGTRLQVIEEGGRDGDRWYKVKLSDGREAWVANSAVTAR